MNYLECLKTLNLGKIQSNERCTIIEYRTILLKQFFEEKYLTSYRKNVMKIIDEVNQYYDYQVFTTPKTLTMAMRKLRKYENFEIKRIALTRCVNWEISYKCGTLTSVVTKKIK